MSDARKPLVQIRHLVKHFPARGMMFSRQKRVVHALDDVSLDIYPGETLGLVGESGCGKTTLGRCVLRLIKPTSGQILFDGQDLSALDHERLRHLRAQMQIVFQNPLSSLSPRLSIRACLEEPLRTHGIPRDEWHSRIANLLTQVGLGKQHLNRYPHELSGGQCQRVAIARAISLEPRLIVLDEPTSALDVSVQAQIINLLADLRRERGLTYLFISHDLGVVEHLSDRIGIMYLGKLVELGAAVETFERPLHPYTQALIASAPNLTVNIKPLAGTIPSPLQPPSGCRFHTRCPLADVVCREREPELREVRTGHWAACHLVE
jgi:peptide/nickel transport system ATP-binding protein